MVNGGRKQAVAFWTLWGGQALSQFGSSLVQFALVWYLTQRTGSATVLATATLVALLPQVVLGPYAGALVDRWNRKAVMMLSDGVVAIATLGMAALFAANIVEVWHVYVIMLIRALGALFQFPAFSATTSLMVNKDQLGRINGLNQALQGLMQVIAPPLGALLLSVIPMQGVLAIDLITAVFAIGPLFFIAIPQPDKSESAQKTSAWQDMVEGFRFIWSWKGMLMICLMAMLLNMFFNPAFALVPLMVTEHFNGGAGELAGIESAMGIGYIVGGVLLGVWGGFKRKIVTALTFLVVGGLLTAAVGFVPSNLYFGSVILFFLISISLPLTNGSFFAVLQALVPADMQGRVFSLVIALATAVSPLGLLVAGPVADAIRVQGWFVIAGAVCGTAALAMFFVRPVMTLEDKIAADKLVGVSSEAAAGAVEATASVE